jgi:DNA-binding PadR family transcriptional regulator
MKAELDWVALAREHVARFHGNVRDRAAHRERRRSAGLGGWMRDSSGLTGPLLALVRDRPAHPYGHATLLRGRLGSGWNIQVPTVCRILERCRERGLLRAQRVTLAGELVRRYEGTCVTAGAVEAWMQSRLPAVPVREPLAVRIALSRPDDRRHLVDALAKHREQWILLLRHYQRRYSSAVWRSMECEVTREGVRLRSAAELEWNRAAHELINDVDRTVQTLGK